MAKTLDGNGTGRSLVIVESPAKAKTINKYLGPQFMVKASVGHVRDMPKRGLNVDIENDFKPTYEITDSAERWCTDLGGGQGCSEVYLATDLDREGEAIAWHLCKAWGWIDKTAKRVVFNEITKTAILNAFKNPRTIDEEGATRSRRGGLSIGWSGIKFRRCCGKRWRAGFRRGGCRSVAVKLVVDRELEIQEFMPEEYWKLTGIFTTDLVQAPEPAQQWRDRFWRRCGIGEEARDDGTDSADAVPAQAAESAGPTVAEKTRIYDRASRRFVPS